MVVAAVVVDIEDAGAVGQAADVRMAVADLRPFPGVDTSALDSGGACRDLFGFVSFSNEDVSADPDDAKVTVAARLYRADRCKDPADDARKLSVKLYPVGFSYTGATADTLAYFGSADGSADGTCDNCSRHD